MYYAVRLERRKGLIEQIFIYLPTIKVLFTTTTFSKFVVKGKSLTNGLGLLNLSITSVGLGGGGSEPKC